MKKLLFSVLGICFSVQILLAQTSPDGLHQTKHTRPKLNKKTKQALRDYQEAFVYPVKKAAQDNFVVALSSEDKLFLEQKQTEHKTLVKEKHALKKQASAWKKKGISTQEIQEKMHDSYAPLKEKRILLLKSMQPFMERNQEHLAIILAPLNENKETWKAAKKSIIAQYMTDSDVIQRDSLRNVQRANSSKNNATSARNKQAKKNMNAVKFVLWDAELNDRKACKGKQMNKENRNERQTNIQEATAGNNITSATVIGQLSNYPNPAKIKTIITFELKGPVKKLHISIRDMDGKLVWKKKLSKLEVGYQSIEIDVQKMAGGQYVYTIEAGLEQISQSMLIQR
jgi:hypothetical protein